MNNQEHQAILARIADLESKVDAMEKREDGRTKHLGNVTGRVLTLENKAKGLK